MRTQESQAEAQSLREKAAQLRSFALKQKNYAAAHRRRAKKYIESAMSVICTFKAQMIEARRQDNLLTAAQMEAQADALTAGNGDEKTREKINKRLESIQLRQSALHLRCLALNQNDEAAAYRRQSQKPIFRDQKEFYTQKARLFERLREETLTKASLLETQAALLEKE